MDSDLQDDVRNTYRYLRMGLAALATMLLASVVIQIGKDGCYQTSISAYFFTPAHAVFIAGLCAIGACLIIYQGDGTTEDVLLNFAGFGAFIVAFVPTTVDSSCSGSVDVPAATTRDSVTNVVPALLIAAVLAVAVASRVNRGTFKWSDWSPWAQSWFVLTSAIMIFGLIMFLVDLDSFIAHAHFIAAASLFVSLILVVISNGITHSRILAKRGDDRGPARNPYAVLAALMLVTGVGAIFVLWLADGWRHRLFWVELAVITEFIAFWSIQTRMLWGYVSPSEKLARTTPKTAAPTP